MYMDTLSTRANFVRPNHTFISKHHTSMIEIAYAFTVGILGIFLGTQIAEGALLVPYWKSLSPQAFFDLHKIQGPKIYRFFAPLTIAATLIPLGTICLGILVRDKVGTFHVLTGLFTLCFFSTYFLFFKKANKEFAEASISPSELPSALRRWGNWHWGRVILEMIAFVCALVVLVRM